VRPAQRALRFMYWNVLPLADGSIFLTFGKNIGLYRDGKIRVLAGLERPCRILRRGAALAADGNVYFGEYLLNRERGPMRVYRYTPGADRVEIVHVFPAGSVRHIHGVFDDPYDGSLWVLSGDVGDECRFMRTTDAFRTIEVIGSGDETWRSVSMLFAPDAIYYAMDAEFTQNYLYRIDRKTHERTRLAAVNGPVYSVARVGRSVLLRRQRRAMPQPAGTLGGIVAPARRRERRTRCDAGEGRVQRPLLHDRHDRLSARTGLAGSRAVSRDGAGGR
jgi:hypothetical protein